MNVLMLAVLSFGAATVPVKRPNGTTVSIAMSNFCVDSAEVGSATPLTHEQLEKIAGILSDPKSQFESKKDYSERIRASADSICSKFMVMPIADSLIYDAETEKLYMRNPVVPDIVDEGGETRVYTFLASSRDSFSLFYDKKMFRKYPVFHVREVYGMLESKLPVEIFDSIPLKKVDAERVYSSVRPGLMIKLNGGIPFDFDSPKDDDIKRRSPYSRVAHSSGWRQDRRAIEDSYTISLGIESFGAVLYDVNSKRVIKIPKN